jgi:hypothetical protein
MSAGSYTRGPRSVEAAQAGLNESRRRVDAQVRRGRWFSWFCWGFLIAFALGEVLIVVFELVFPMVTTTVTSSGTSTSTTAPVWGPIVAFAPAVILLGLALRELILGRRESLRGSSSSSRAETDLSVAPPWTEEIRIAQERLTRGASEIEWSFVPLVLGFLALGELAVSFALSGTGSSGSPSALLVLGPILGGLALGVLPIGPIYRAAKQWIRSGQERLELQSRELTLLEAEFLWRFAGAASGP